MTKSYIILCWPWEKVESSYCVTWQLHKYESPIINRIRVGSIVKYKETYCYHYLDKDLSHRSVNASSLAEAQEKLLQVLNAQIIPDHLVNLL